MLDGQFAFRKVREQSPRIKTRINLTTVEKKGFILPEFSVKDPLYEVFPGRNLKIRDASQLDIKCRFLLRSVQIYWSQEIKIK